VSEIRNLPLLTTYSEFGVYMLLIIGDLAVLDSPNREKQRFLGR